MEEYPKLAVNSKNIHITRRGFSPKQLMFGKQGVVPVIMDGNPASIEPVTENDGFRRGLMNGQRAEELYKNVDAIERIQKAPVQKTQGYSVHRYVKGEQALFNEEGKTR